MKQVRTKTPPARSGRAVDSARARARDRSMPAQVAGRSIRHRRGARRSARCGGGRADPRQDSARAARVGAGSGSARADVPRLERTVHVGFSCRATRRVSEATSACSSRSICCRSFRSRSSTRERRIRRLSAGYTLRDLRTALASVATGAARGADLRLRRRPNLAGRA